jgi:hypothetical protein
MAQVVRILKHKVLGSIPSTAKHTTHTHPTCKKKKIQIYSLNTHRLSLRKLLKQLFFCGTGI